LVWLQSKLSTVHPLKCLVLGWSGERKGIWPVKDTASTLTARLTLLDHKLILCHYSSCSSSSWCSSSC